MNNVKDPTMHDQAKWEHARSQPVNTSIRQDYNNVMLIEKVGSMANAVYSRNPIQILNSFIRTTAVPLADYSGSPKLKNVVEYGIYAYDLVTDPLSKISGELIRKLANSATSAISSYVHNPKWKDLIDISGSELGNYSANCVHGEIQKKRKRSEEKFNDIASKKVKVSHEQKEYDTSLFDNEQLLKKHEKIKQLPQDAQWLADCGYNAASGKGLQKNKLQIALEVSTQVNALSLTADPLRHSDMFETAQNSKNKKNHNGHIIARINEIKPQIAKENEITIQRSQTQINQQKDVLNQASQAFEQSKKSLDVIDLFNGIYHAQPINQYKEYVTTPTPKDPKKPSSNEYTPAWIQDLYAANEDKAKRNKAKNLKLEIAKGIATDLCSISGSHEMREAWIHQIHNSMDTSDRRWSNDVCGEIHKIITGSSTDDFAYKSTGMKKMWDATTKYPKKILSYGENSTTVNAQVNTNGNAFLGTNYNPQMIQLNHPKTSDPIFQSQVPWQKQPEFYIDEFNDMEVEENLAKKDDIPLPSPISKKVIVEKVSILPKPTVEKVSIQPKPILEKTTILPEPLSQNSNTALNNVKNAAALLHSAQKKIIGYSNWGKVETVLDAASEINEYGLTKGIWNTVVDVAIIHGISKAPYLRETVAISSLYNDNVPKDKACEIFKETYEYVKKINKEQGTNFFTYQVEQESLESYRDCQKGDSALRFPSEVFKKVTEFFRVEK